LLNAFYANRLHEVLFSNVSIDFKIVYKSRKPNGRCMSSVCRVLTVLSVISVANSLYNSVIYVYVVNFYVILH